MYVYIYHIYLYKCIFIIYLWYKYTCILYIITYVHMYQMTSTKMRRPRCMPAWDTVVLIVLVSLLSYALKRVGINIPIIEVDLVYYIFIGIILTLLWCYIDVILILHLYYIIIVDVLLLYYCYIKSILHLFLGVWKTCAKVHVVF